MSWRFRSVSRSPRSSRLSWSLHLFLGRPMFLRLFGLYCSACFGSLFVSILCTCCSHFSCTMFSAPVFYQILFSLSSFVIPSKFLKSFISAASKRLSSLFFSTQASLPNFSAALTVILWILNFVSLFLLKYVIKGKINWGVYVTGRRGRRCKQLLNELKETRGYWRQKEDATDNILWRGRFGGGYSNGVIHSGLCFVESASLYNLVNKSN